MVIGDDIIDFCWGNFQFSENGFDKIGGDVKLKIVENYG